MCEDGSRCESTTVYTCQGRCGHLTQLGNGRNASTSIPSLPLCCPQCRVVSTVFTLENLMAKSVLRGRPR